MLEQEEACRTCLNLRAPRYGQKLFSCRANKTLKLDRVGNLFIDEGAYKLVVIRNCPDYKEEEGNA